MDGMGTTLCSQETLSSLGQQDADARSLPAAFTVLRARVIDWKAALHNVLIDCVFISWTAVTSSKKLLSGTVESH